MQTISQPIPLVNGKARNQMATNRFAFIKKWWKSVAYAIGIIATLIAIGTPGYIISERLNSFASKEDLSSLQTELQTQISELKKEQKENFNAVDSNLKNTNDSIFKIYKILIEKK